MTKFDSDSIYYRALAMLQQDPSWKVTSSDSVVSALIRSNAEIIAEAARYTEYLFNESKWDTAQNTSSILAMAGLLGYRPKRKISASGKIYISSNPGIQQLNASGALATLKNINERNLWGVSESFKVTTSSTITDSSGNSYVGLPTVLSSGNSYTTLTILEGKRKAVYVDINTIKSTATTSKLDPYLYIPVVINDCEAAESVDAKKFFSVSVITSDGSALYAKEYRIVDSLLLSDSGDYDVEVYNDLYSRSLFYLKFNNDPLRGSILDISSNSSIAGIRIDYLESKGAAGNLTDTFDSFTIKNVSGTSSKKTYTLYGINLEAISGGADEETVSDIKTKAPKYYISNFSVGTKESYVKTIETLKLQVPYYKDTDKSTPYYKEITPKKVKVYGKTEKTDNGLERKVTAVTFLDDDLEDFASTTNEADSLYGNVASTLELYLDALKSPQDVIKFYSPEYISFATSITCTLDKEGDSLDANETQVRKYINDQWGSSSSELDFDRSFYSAEMVYSLKKNFKDIINISIETEAIKKLNWDEATRMDPNGLGTNVIHTCRLPFEFSGLFLGSKNTLGFKDHRVGAEYVMRVDFMYKTPASSISTSNLHTSLFVKETKGGREKNPFYIVNDTNSNSLTWDISELSATTNTDYSCLSSQTTSKLTKGYQFRYKKGIYSDDDFRRITSTESSSEINTLKSHLTDLGTVDDYLIYFDASYGEEEDVCGQGWIEFTFDSFYSVLSYFSAYNSEISSFLKKCPLSVLKCGTSDANTTISAFSAFKKIAEQYIDIYVSFRPVDESIKIDTTNENYSNSVLYIDSEDSDKKLNEDKKPRMISLNFKYEE